VIELPPELASLNIQPPWGEEYRYQRFVINENGEAYPLLSIKGYGLYNSTKRHILAIGTRKASKSICIANKVARHLWETDGAVVAVVCRSIKNAKIGVWKDLVNFVLPGWENAGWGFKIEKVGVDGVSKMEYVRVRNQHGTISEVQLHSCDYAFAAPEKFKGARFSMVWISEADQFEDRILFDSLCDQLRVLGLDFSKHQIIVDCNWPEEGSDSHLFCIFEEGKNPDSKYFRDNYHDEFEIRLFSLYENPFLDPREKDDLKRRYAHDVIKFKRLVDNPTGEWAKDVSAGHFDDVVLPNIHFIGKCEGSDKSKWEVITPEKSSITLYTGNDPGGVNNHACSFICTHRNPQDEIVFSVFDEVVSVGTNLNVKKFAYEVFERVKFWTEWIAKDNPGRPEVKWYHFADDSVVGYDARAHRTDAQIFKDVSGGKIDLIPVEKGHGSIMQRIDMTKRLFFDNRLFISAHCRWNIAWARYLKPGKKQGETIAPSSKIYNHSFSATSYALRKLVPIEGFQHDTPSVAQGIITT